MFGGKTFESWRLKERVLNAQQEISIGWKNIADKAKKEAKIVNRKARKVLATEDGGDLREDVLSVNLDFGYEFFKKYQEGWVSMHADSVTNVQNAEEADRNAFRFAKEWRKWKDYLDEFHGNLVVLPEVIAKVEIIQSRIDAIGKQTEKIEEMLLDYEDACERYELEKQKMELKVKLSELVETKHAEYTLKKSLYCGQPADTHTVVEEQSAIKLANSKKPDLQHSADKQKAYEDVFMEQMNRYIQYGELDKPIAGSVGHTLDVNSVNNIQIGDDDLSTLSEFLGPEELSSVLQAAQSSKKKALKDSETSNTIKSDNRNQELELQNTEQAIDTNDSNIKTGVIPQDVENIEVIEKCISLSETSAEYVEGSEKTADTNIFKENSEVHIDADPSDAEVIVERKPSETSDDENEFFDAASGDEQ